MPDLIDPSEIMFTPFEPKVKNRFIMYIEGIPAYLIKAANRPTITFEEIDISEIINENKYITHDITLPVIEGNSNIQCTNPECESIKGDKPSSLKYIKYDSIMAIL
mgnify:CR=1 FL=1